MASVDEGQDVIDSRDVIERIEELEGEREAAREAASGPADSDSLREALEVAALKAWDAGDEGQELKALRGLQAEAEGYAEDWHYGVAIIADSYFTEYAQQLADDLGAVPEDAKWPLTCIDWEQAANELKQDYTSVTFGSTEYWVR